MASAVDTDGADARAAVPRMPSLLRSSLAAALVLATGCSTVLGTDLDDAQARSIPVEPVPDASTEPVVDGAAPEQDAGATPAAPLPACEYQIERSGTATATSGDDLLVVRAAADASQLALKVPIEGDVVASVVLDRLSPGRSDAERSTASLGIVCPSKAAAHGVVFRTDIANNAIVTDGNLTGSVVYEPARPVAVRILRQGPSVTITIAQGGKVLTEKATTLCEGAAKIGVGVVGPKGTEASFRTFRIEGVCADPFSAKTTY